MATTVGDIVSGARRILSDDDEVRWSNVELIQWLNECYAVLTRVKPSECTVSEALTLVAGTKQTIPDDAERLIEISHNTAGSMGVIDLISRKELDAVLPTWHSEPETEDIEHYIFDEMVPNEFFVSPPALNTAEVYAYLIKVPSSHSKILAVSEDDPISVKDSMAPMLIDYILFRAFSKDADHASYANRAALHLNAFNMQADTGFKLEMATSPNAEAK
ncbi:MULTISPECIES: DUF6682 family protein [unclassified Neptuniibacter]|uniref:phage adaptor protein n=1 Tax=unclassified Neptuniibacter TaxID=2630693 RepID=UPI000C6830B9|nr:MULTISPECIES: DUF6682 family protein [unclassified Neptuniibacter]MAY41677.1 hypothetical protein [Oceanospirillaceae bacterium]|tara:strand:+ start:118 stop:771 length:654 start_codon:yes stop_codon:yes gene_type:complete